MFDDEGQMMCWFDTEVQSEAIGIPEGVLNEFMFSLSGPLAITERVYASPGQVKAVIIKDFGLDVTKNVSRDPLESLHDFVRDFGLTLITRPRSGKSLEFNDGRYYSSTHDRKANSTAEPKAWCVYDGFNFLKHVEATDEAQARKNADSQLGLNKPLTVFLDSGAVTTHAARNTFSLFQKHGGLSVDWTENNAQVGPLTRADFRFLVDRMQNWVTNTESAKAAESVGSDLGYVRSKIDDFNELLNNPRWAYSTLIKIELVGYNNRQNEADYERADAYSDLLYTSTPEG